MDARQHHHAPGSAPVWNLSRRMAALGLDRTEFGVDSDGADMLAIGRPAPSLPRWIERHVKGRTAMRRCPGHRCRRRWRADPGTCHGAMSDRFCSHLEHLTRNGWVDAESRRPSFFSDPLSPRRPTKRFPVGGARLDAAGSAPVIAPVRRESPLAILMRFVQSECGSKPARSRLALLRAPEGRVGCFSTGAEPEGASPRPRLPIATGLCIGLRPQAVDRAMADLPAISRTSGRTVPGRRGRGSSWDGPA